MPVEQVKPGDLVLSRGESEEGERSYKPVTQIVQHEDCQVIMVMFGGRQADGTARWHQLPMTPEQSVWVRGKGWKPAGSLKMRWPNPSALELVANENADASSSVRLFSTGMPNIAWVPDSPLGSALDSYGRQLDVRTLQLVGEGFFSSSSRSAARSA